MTTPIILKPLNGTARIATDSFRVIQAEEADDLESISGPVLVPFATWQTQKDTLRTRAQQGELGVWLSPEDNPEELGNDVTDLPLIAFYFPVFKFGQGYSGAVLLRSRYNFKGEIRAFGDIWRDQLFYLARCGFTQFVIKEGKSIEDAIEGFNDFSTPYQTSADNTLPIFTRRLA